MGYRTRPGFQPRQRQNETHNFFDAEAQMWVHVAHGSQRVHDGDCDDDCTRFYQQPQIRQPHRHAEAYALLGLDPYRTTPQEVTRAYRALARLHHPDTGGDPDRMKAINAAYELIRVTLI